jgi:murein tripeptide amidase MpaA
MHRNLLCKTIAGVDCELLTVTDTYTQTDEDPAAELKENKRKAVVISSRVHPGETVGSWMMRGILFFLTDPDNQEASLLRKNFVFKIIPMLNPDGVINGNYRCSLAGCDLNRRWKFPSKTLQPTIYHCKKLIKHVHQER